MVECLFVNGRDVVEANVWVEFKTEGPITMAFFRVSDPRVPRREPVAVSRTDPRAAISLAFSHSTWSVWFRGDDGPRGYRSVVIGDSATDKVEQRDEWVFFAGEMAVISGEENAAWEAVAGGQRARGYVIGADPELRGWRVAITNR